MEQHFVEEPCQEGWHRPVLSLFAKVFTVFSCILPKVTCSRKFAFAKHSAAMKAPVGLLSDRTVLQSNGTFKSMQGNTLCKGKQAVQAMRRKAPDSGKCANGVQKVCSHFPT